MDSADYYNNEVVITDCKDIGRYLLHQVIRKNWFEFKQSLSAAKKRWSKRCNKCKSKTEIELFDSDDEDIVTFGNKTKNFKITLEQMTSNYMQITNNGNKSNDALLYYINEWAKNKKEKIDFGFVGELLSKGININYNDSNDENALFKAVQAENEELVIYLLEKSINFKQISKFGCCIFHICAKNETVVITRLIADKFKKKEELQKYINFKTNHEKQTPLHYAAKYGSAAVAECIISEYGAEREPLDYRNRTPLYIGAEFSHQSFVRSLMRLNCCVSFTNKAKTEILYNTKGQPTLYWIVTKMPDIAKEALDELHEANSFMRKEKHYLTPLEPNVNKKRKENGEVIPKSVLAGIVESENLDLIEHPTIRCLIDVKWELFARTNAWIDFLVTIINVAIWITFSVWVPYDQRHSYDFNSTLDCFRMSLFILGALFTFYLIFGELREVYRNTQYQAKSNELREQELEEYKKTANKEEINSAFLADEELSIRQNNFLKVLKDYVSDIWNLYDWLTLILLCVCIGTHIQDIVEHTENTAVNHIRLMAITVIFVCLRLLKSSRIIIQKFGALVMILYYAISDMVIWFILYAIIWLSFSCAFWMIYGGVKFDKSTPENMQCVDNYVQNKTYNTTYYTGYVTTYNTTYNATLLVYNTTYNISYNYSYDFPYNCTTTSVIQFERYDTTAYYLYKLTFGSDISEPSLEAIDLMMAKPLLGAYVGLTTLVLVNIFIALLTATFDRIYEKAEAYIIFQRAIEILNAEKAMAYDERKAHIKHIRKIGSPYSVRLKKELITYTDDRLTNLENELKQQKAVLSTMEKTMEYSNISFQHQSNKTNESFKRLEQQEPKLLELLTRQQKLEELLATLGNDIKTHLNSVSNNVVAPEDPTMQSTN